MPASGFVSMKNPRPFCTSAITLVRSSSENCRPPSGPCTITIPTATLPSRYALVGPAAATAPAPAATAAGAPRRCSRHLPGLPVAGPAQLGRAVLVRLTQPQGREAEALGLVEVVAGTSSGARNIRSGRFRVRRDDAHASEAMQDAAGRTQPSAPSGASSTGSSVRPRSPAISSRPARSQVGSRAVKERRSAPLASAARALEALLELRPGAQLDAIAPRVEVRQLFPPRLAIVAADEEGLRALEQSPEVLSVHTDHVPYEALAQLDEPARIFAAAWNERRRPKQRPGDGQPWDAPGHDAP